MSIQAFKEEGLLKAPVLSVGDLANITSPEQGETRLIKDQLPDMIKYTYIGVTWSKDKIYKEYVGAKDTKENLPESAKILGNLSVVNGTVNPGLYEGTGTDTTLILPTVIKDLHLTGTATWVGNKLTIVDNNDDVPDTEIDFTKYNNYVGKFTDKASISEEAKAATALSYIEVGDATDPAGLYVGTGTDIELLIERVDPGLLLKPMAGSNSIFNIPNPKDGMRVRDLNTGIMYEFFKTGSSITAGYELASNKSTGKWAKETIVPYDTHVLLDSLKVQRVKLEANATDLTLTMTDPTTVIGLDDDYGNFRISKSSSTSNVLMTINYYDKDGISKAGFAGDTPNSINVTKYESAPDTYTDIPDGKFTVTHLFKSSTGVQATTLKTTIPDKLYNSKEEAYVDIIKSVRYPWIDKGSAVNDAVRVGVVITSNTSTNLLGSGDSELLGANEQGDPILNYVTPPGLRKSPVATVAELRMLKANRQETRLVDENGYTYTFEITSRLTSAQNTSPSSIEDDASTGKWYVTESSKTVTTDILVSEWSGLISYTDDVSVTVPVDTRDATRVVVVFTESVTNKLQTFLDIDLTSTVKAGIVSPYNTAYLKATITSTGTDTVFKFKDNSALYTVTSVKVYKADAINTIIPSNEIIARPVNINLEPGFTYIDHTTSKTVYQGANDHVFQVKLAQNQTLVSAVDQNGKNYPIISEEQGLLSVNVPIGAPIDDIVLTITTGIALVISRSWKTAWVLGNPTYVTVPIGLTGVTSIEYIYSENTGTYRQFSDKVRYLGVGTTSLSSPFSTWHVDSRIESVATDSFLVKFSVYNMSARLLSILCKNDL